MEQQFKRTHLQKENARNRICTNKQGTNRMFLVCLFPDK